MILSYSDNINLFYIDIENKNDIRAESSESQESAILFPNEIESRGVMLGG